MSPVTSTINHSQGKTFMKTTQKSLTNGYSQELIDEIVVALKRVGAYGSIEIYVQNSNVTQITVRNIKKTKHNILE